MKNILKNSPGYLFIFLLLFLFAFSTAEGQKATLTPSSGLRVATFDVNATPPQDFMMAYNPVARSYDMNLRAKGIILLGAGQPIVLLALDWIGVANAGQDAFKKALAEAAGTTPQRVAVHSLHPHDAPRGEEVNGFVSEVIKSAAEAAKASLSSALPVTHISMGEAQVYKIASNRRIMGPDGKVKVNRMSSCKDSLLRAEPEGLIDPMISVIGLWNGDKPVAVLSFYATHPQSYYRLGIPNPDFPGIARFYRQLEVPDALFIHFTGAAGNVAAGKYNDGSHEMRGILAQRLADGMRRAYDAGKRQPISAREVSWGIEPVTLIPDTTRKSQRSLTFIKRWKEGKQIDIECLSLGKARILFMPGELFVEYQLAAKKMRPDLFVTMAAYGEGCTGYIPTAKAFPEEGYEVGASGVTPQAEPVLMDAMKKLLK